MSRRLCTLLAAFDGSPDYSGLTTKEAIARIVAHIDAGAPQKWLTLSVLRGQVPTSDEVVEARRTVRLDSSEAWIRGELRHRVRRTVEVVTGAVLVDVHHTARTTLATGIQRVVRNTIQHWVKQNETVLIGWSSDFRSILRLSPDEQQNALHGTKGRNRKGKKGKTIVPWKSIYILPELAIEGSRVARIQALAEFSGNTCSAIGYDCVPMTTADTIGAGMGGAFGRYLSAVARMDCLVVISAAAATEFEGWRRMLPSAGLSGPEIIEIILPTAAGRPTTKELAAARSQLVTEGMPLVVVIGSHEPRKNHLAVLFAANQLWRDGREFSLVFIGGNSWDSAGFFDELTVLARLGRPIRSITAVTDALLWGAYSLADLTLFPLLNEGFGLPVAESLASGTPVVTSNYGSMRQIARNGGALLVDPRHDLDIAAALESALFDPTVADRLAAEAAIIPHTNWHDYATSLWSAFTQQAKI